MARTARQLAALGVTMAVAMSGSNTTSLSKGLGQDELGIELDGKKLFDKETFGGNGRTCLTCHSKDTGTLTLADVQRIIEKADPERQVPDPRRAGRGRSRHDARPGTRHHSPDHPIAAMALAGG